jgi:hypothetical protein
MNKPVVAPAASLFMCLVMSLACGGGDKDIDITDGGQGVECDPIAQDCDEGEKCTSIIVSEAPFESKTACAPNGTGVAGDACEYGDIGEETGYDNCAAGFLCLQGECVQICQRSGTGDNCVDGDNRNCLSLSDTFSEMELVMENIGVCLPSCDPIGDATTTPYTNCPASQGCYIIPTTGQGSCGPVPYPTKGQDQLCDSGEGCFLNACARGHVNFLPQMPGASATRVCAGMCNPVNTHTGSPGGAAGGTVNCNTDFADASRPDNGTGPTPPYQCRFVQSFFADTAAVPTSIGFCVSDATWGDCTLCDISTQATFLATCKPGCVDLATEGMIMAVSPAAVAPTSAARALEKPYLPGEYYGMSMATSR